MRKKLLNSMYLYNKIYKNNFFVEEKKINKILRKCYLEKILFKNKFFYRTEFYKTDFNQVSFENCKFNQTIFNTVEFNKTRFLNCTFNNVEFSHLEIKNKIFNNCKFKNISFNLTILNNKNHFPRSIIAKNKNDIIYKNKKGDLFHNKKVFQFLKKEKKTESKKNNYYYNSNIKVCKNNDKIFKKCNFTYNLKKISSSKKETHIINDLINGNGVIKIGPKFSKIHLEKAKQLCFKNSKYKENNCLNKKKLASAILNLYSIDPVFLKLLPPKYILDIIAKILGENYYSGLYSSNVLLPGAKSSAYHMDYPYTTMPKDEDGVLKNFSYKNPINVQSLLFLTDINTITGPTFIIPGTQILQLEPKRKKIFIDADQTKIVFKHKKKWHKYRITPLTGKKGTMFIFNGLAWHSVGDNMSYNKLRISMNHQFIPNYIRPMHNLTNQKKTSYLLDKMTGQNFIHPVNL